METILLVLFILSVCASLCCLVKFLQYYVSELMYVKNCKTAKGTIVRWTTTSSSSISYKSSWWRASSHWSPIISYYDVTNGSTQEHEVILPKGCHLSQDFSPAELEIQYLGRHVRISDERYVNLSVYYGYQFCIMFAIMLIASFLSGALYYFI